MFFCLFANHIFSIQYLHTTSYIIKFYHADVICKHGKNIPILQYILCEMAKELNNTQKKEWAKTLYLKENLTQQEIADRVGVSRITVNRWIADGKWEEQKVGLTLTREEQVSNLYRQVAEINRKIAEKPEGERFASTTEADILGKLSAAIRKMETDVGIADVISVQTKFIEFLRPIDLDKAKELTQLSDAFIKSIL